MANWEGTELQGFGTTNVNRICLDVKGGGSADGTLVRLFPCNGTGAQRWIYNTSGQVVNVQSNKCLDLQKSVTSFPSTVIRSCNVNSLTQQWQIQ